MTDAMQRQIADALDRADRDPEVAVAVIEGEGRDFCAGNDLGLIADMASGTLSVDDLAVDDFLGALSGFDNPLVAGVQGRAIGVGATLLLHCDVVVAAHDSRLSFPFVDISLVPEAGSGFLLPARIGYARAYALLCLAEPVSRREAAAMGLITRSVEAADLAAGLRDVAARLAAKPGQALRATKALMKDKAAIAAALAADRAIFLEQIKALGS